ncbi:MAG TPA: aspartate ammonia-lyase [Burkholderiales bacterium]|jgi:aspartate ammonia-lyase|nr:aspartate ammonia-lyase [Burkholderiales bacterium]
MRIESDFLGQREISDDVYYGVQTLRGRENFIITGVGISAEPRLVVALAYVKKACAMANRDLGLLSPPIADAIMRACDRLIAGEFLDQFVIDFIQGGAGTSTNMNANEVIANVALEHLGHRKGDYHHVSPNDHVNLSQSTNDVYPTALRLALILRLKSYIDALTALQSSFFAKGEEFAGVLKMGRTHLQDAVPMPLGAEFHGFGTTIGEEIQRIQESIALLTEINLGATAIGTSVNAPDGYPQLATRHLAALTGIDFKLASDLVEATSDTGVFVQLSGVLKRTAVKLTKICNDLRLLSSGPRSGLNEINLPRLQPGSSIMPGKVNPVIPEVVNQTAFLVIGLDLTVTLAASAGQLQLNVMEPVIAFALVFSIFSMENAVTSLRERCVDGITANAERTHDMVMNSISIVTLLNPVIGYKKATEIAHEAHESGKSIHQVAVVERKLLTQKQWDRLYSFANLIKPQFMKDEYAGD